MIVFENRMLKRFVGSKSGEVTFEKTTRPASKFFLFI
jgi:hypothetical protein